MSFINIEIKAQCADLGKIRDWLNAQQADFKGTDRQTDTYFRQMTQGRLKLREGNIENALIYYERPNDISMKKSQVMKIDNPPVLLKEMLTTALGVLITVEKEREIYFMENVKFHLDTVAGLGTFVEIEAIDSQNILGEAYLRTQCLYYIEQFGIQEKDLEALSYSDMRLETLKDS
jgi:predicted adenylyl cyclase CyaB